NNLKINNQMSHSHVQFIPETPMEFYLKKTRGHCNDATSKGRDKPEPGTGGNIGCKRVSTIPVIVLESEDSSSLEDEEEQRSKRLGKSDVQKTLKGVKSAKYKDDEEKKKDSTQVKGRTERETSQGSKSWYEMQLRTMQHNYEEREKN
ncbi:hypothetical protein RFI_33129, partial [Reticulomyxa filosa]